MPVVYFIFFSRHASSGTESKKRLERLSTGEVAYAVSWGGAASRTPHTPQPWGEEDARAGARERESLGFGILSSDLLSPGILSGREDRCSAIWMDAGTRGCDDLFLLPADAV